MPSHTFKEEDFTSSNLDARKLDFLEQRIDKLHILKKRSDDKKTVEGVFDTATLFHLYYLITHGFIDTMRGVLATGKEANVYYGQASVKPAVQPGQDTTSSSPENTKPPVREIAIKIYRTSTADFKQMRQYYYGDPRFKKIRHGTRPLIYAWARKEYQNLLEMEAAGVQVPKPLAVRGNVLVMQFLGENGLPAPLLKNYIFSSKNEAMQIFKKLFKSVELLYREAALVHADLSEYNVMMYRQPYIIDVSQSVPLEHPLAEEFLARDVNNLARYFTGVGAKIPPVEKLIETIHRA